MKSSVGFFFLCFLASALSYYLPGVAPKDFSEGDPVELTVNALRSPHSIVPYDYVYPKFNFCPPKSTRKVTSSLGSILFGDRVFESTYNLSMGHNTTCQLLCTKALDKVHVNFLIERIQERFYHNWFVDSLPAARITRDNGEEFYSVGFELGKKDENAKNVKEAKPELRNHHAIVVEYHEVENKPGVYRVVGVVVFGYSKKYTLNADDMPDCTNQVPPLILEHDTPVTVTYTYEVYWKASEISWGTRWDHYLHTYDPKIHWFSLINSFVIVLFLTFMVGMILLRALHKDISRYNQPESQEEAQEEYGWKLVHGDVFRTPTNPLLLSVFVGNGVQVILMACVTLVLALLGFLSPAIRGSLVTVAIVFYVCFGFAAGYSSALLYKMFGGEAWKRCVVLTACLIPGVLSIILLTLNFVLVGMQSSAAVPFGTLAGLLSMWIFLSCPLCFVGAYLGFKREKIAYPVRINQIPRQIPPQSFYLRRVPAILLGGILPFGAIFIELYFIMNSIWFNRIYYVFGFLSLVFLILMITCSEVTILLCYFHLCAEDYRWWWRAFFTSGCSALYVLIYSIFYYIYRLEMSNFVSLVLYFGWIIVMCILFFILTGTIGFLASLWFVRKIYAAIKID